MWTNKEKLFLYNQYEMLKFLDPNNADDYIEKQKIIEYGSEADMDYLIEYFDGTSTEVANDVWSMLSMFRALTFSYENLEDKGDVLKEQVMWDGFDGNEESEYYAYAKHLLHDRELFAEFKDVDPNSHWHRIDRYRNMLNEYKKHLVMRQIVPNDCVQTVADLSLEEIKQIINCL